MGTDDECGFWPLETMVLFKKGTGAYGLGEGSAVRRGPFVYLEKKSGRIIAGAREKAALAERGLCENSGNRKQELADGRSGERPFTKPAHHTKSD